MLLASIDYFLTSFIFFIFLKFEYSGGRRSEGINQEGIDFYNRVINETIKNGNNYFLSFWGFKIENKIYRHQF